MSLAISKQSFYSPIQNSVTLTNCDSRCEAFPGLTHVSFKQTDLVSGKPGDHTEHGQCVPAMNYNLSLYNGNSAVLSDDYWPFK